MPNRILKESIRTSKKVNALSDFQFRLWSYLITYVDDFGRGSAEPAIIKGFVFPLRSNVTEKSIQTALRDLATMGMIHLYDVEGDSFLCFPNWDKHQRIRQKVSRFPAPDETKYSELRQDAASCGELRQDAAECGLNPNPNTNTNTNPNTNPKYSCAEPETASAPEADDLPFGEPEPDFMPEPIPDPVFISLPLVGNDSHEITETEVDEYRALYPAVDVEQELRNMRGWLMDNPTRRKTKRGIAAFVGNWLRKEQDRGKSAGGYTAPRSVPGRVDFQAWAEKMEAKERAEKEAANGL